MKLPQPFPYQGSKRHLVPKILPYLPRDCATFWEPFSGSAAMTLAASAAQCARHYVINDINAPLAQLWRAIIDDPSGLAGRYEVVWKEQTGREAAFYNEVRAAFNQHRREDHFLFLLARCVKAAVRYNSRGEFNQSPDPRRRGMLPATMRANLAAVSALLRGRTSVHSMDYAALCEQAAAADVIYMDPPYQGVSRNRDHRYASALAYEPFVEALAEMNRRGLSYLVSYDGRTGGRQHGRALPESLNLTLVEIDAGRSSQATLLGRSEITVESLYLSEAIVKRLPGESVSVSGEPAVLLSV